MLVENISVLSRELLNLLGCGWPVRNNGMFRGDRDHDTVLADHIMSIAGICCRPTMLVVLAHDRSSHIRMLCGQLCGEGLRCGLGGHYLFLANLDISTVYWAWPSLNTCFVTAPGFDFMTLSQAPRAPTEVLISLFTIFVSGPMFRKK